MLLSGTNSVCTFWKGEWNTKSPEGATTCCSRSIGWSKNSAQSNNERNRSRPSLTVPPEKGAYWWYMLVVLVVVTWSIDRIIDRIIQRQARITWGVGFIRANFFHLFSLMYWLTWPLRSIFVFFQLFDLPGTWSIDGACWLYSCVVTSNTTLWACSDHFWVLHWSEHVDLLILVCRNTITSRIILTLFSFSIVLKGTVRKSSNWNGNWPRTKRCFNSTRNPCGTTCWMKSPWPKKPRWWRSWTVERSPKVVNRLCSVLGSRVLKLFILFSVDFFLDCVGLFLWRWNLVFSVDLLICFWVLVLKELRQRAIKIAAVEDEIHALKNNNSVLRSKVTVSRIVFFVFLFLLPYL
jgi:hypothetical protein